MGTSPQWAAALLRGAARRRQRVVIEDRRQPFLGLRQRPVLALGVILDLIALDFADTEIIAFGMTEIEPAHRSAGPHGEAFGKPDADLALAVEQREQRRLFAVVGLRRIAGRRPDAAIFFGDKFIVG